MKNSMLDLHNHLMARMEELGDEELEGEKLDGALRRAEASVKVAGAMIDNSRLVLDARKLIAEHRNTVDPADMPMLTARKQAR